MRKNQTILAKNDINLAIEQVQKRLIESAKIGDFENAKKELVLLQGLIKLCENFMPSPHRGQEGDRQTIAARRASRDKLIRDLSKKLARLNFNIKD